MKNIILPCIVTMLFMSCTGQQRFDLASFTVPKGWQQTSKEGTFTISKEDTKKGTYCLVTLYKSLDAGSNAGENFNHSWEALVKENLGADAVPEMQPAVNDDGWEVLSGHAAFSKDGLNGVALLIAGTGYNKLANILILTNSDVYEKEMTAFLESVNYSKPSSAPTNTTTAAATLPSPAAGGFKFTSTNFDDGWVATEQTDWVEATKGNIKALLHFETDVQAANTDPDVMCAAAWNKLVAPRYKNMQGYKVAPNMLDYERAYFVKATLTDNQGGQPRFVALFKKGQVGWIEIVCPDEQTFINAFGIDISKIDHNTSTNIWDPLKKLANLNKFAVDAGDLKGKWTNNFAGNTYYTNINTGLSAGMSTYSSGQEYNFLPGQKYKWHIVAVNSYGGNSSFAQGKGEGSWKLNSNWEIYFSNMEGKPRTEAVQFSCIKGGRILWIGGTALVLSHEKK
ncbi:MAG: hypothetical protein QM687_09755 [Ferruginibacter sp.]